MNRPSIATADVWFGAEFLRHPQTEGCLVVNSIVPVTSDQVVKPTPANCIPVMAKSVNNEEWGQELPRVGLVLQVTGTVISCVSVRRIAESEMFEVKYHSINGRFQIR